MLFWLLVTSEWCDDFTLRGKYEHKRHCSNQQNCYIARQLMCKSVSTGQLQNGGYVTEGVVDLVRMTETQSEDPTRLPYLHWYSTGPGAHRQLEARLWGHDQGIVQRVTEGPAAVRSHHRQEEALSGSEDKEEAHLGSTGQQRNAPVLSPKVHQDPRESDEHLTDFQGGKIYLGKIHGFVQCRVKSSYNYSEVISS